MLDRRVPTSVTCAGGPFLVCVNAPVEAHYCVWAIALVLLYRQIGGAVPIAIDPRYTVRIGCHGLLVALA